MKLPRLYVCFATHAVQGTSSTLFHYFFARVKFWIFFRLMVHEIQPSTFKPTIFYQTKTKLNSKMIFFALQSQSSLIVAILHKFAKYYPCFLVDFCAVMIGNEKYNEARLSSKLDKLILQNTF